MQRRLRAFLQRIQIKILKSVAPRVVIGMAVLGVLLSLASYLLESATGQATWVSNFLMSIGASFCSAVPIYILFELVISQSKFDEDRANAHRVRVKEEQLRLLRLSSTKEEKQRIIDELKQENLLEDTDLHGLDLSEIKFEKANLSYADFREAKLHRADFSLANLQLTQFTNADLSDANLSGANLRRASMRHTVFKNAILVSVEMTEGCFIGGADLRGANLSNADLRGARISDENKMTGEPVCDETTTLPTHEKWGLSRSLKEFIEY